MQEQEPQSQGESMRGHSMCSKGASDDPALEESLSNFPEHEVPMARIMARIMALKFKDEVVFADAFKAWKESRHLSVC